MNVPVIRLELEGMRMSVKRALLEQGALLDEEVQLAISRLCTEENLRKAIEEAAQQQFTQVVRQAVWDGILAQADSMVRKHADAVLWKIGEKLHE